MMAVDSKLMDMEIAIKQRIGEGKLNIMTELKVHFNNMVNSILQMTEMMETELVEGLANEIGSLRNELIDENARMINEKLNSTPKNSSLELEGHISRARDSLATSSHDNSSGGNDSPSRRIGHSWYKTKR